jgi:enamine deaminase RidA (YjgF/YER057c/UK114 family)
MRIFRIAVAGLLCFSLVALAQRGKKQDQEPVTQILQLPPDPPAALAADPARLVFDVAPLTSKGLLSQQVRDQTKWILSRYGRARIIKIRAFVAGSGDLRRVQAVVSEMFSEKRISLPVFSVVLVGALPLTGAQVQMEITAEDRKAVNPAGLAFIAGQLLEGEPGTAKSAALARESMTRVRAAMEAAGAQAARRVTCFVSDIENASEIRQASASMFPKTPFTLVQAQRGFARPLAECEAVASLARPPAAPVVRINPPSLPAATRYSHVVAVNTPRLVFAGAQMAFNFEDADAKLAFERLERTLRSAGSSLKQTIIIEAYPLSTKLAGLVRKYWFEFLDEAAPPASTLMILEGLPSMDAAFALEVVALPNEAAK